jgi:hypothetical protein
MISYVATFRGSPRFFTECALEPFHSSFFADGSEANSDNRLLAYLADRGMPRCKLRSSANVRFAGSILVSKYSRKKYFNYKNSQQNASEASGCNAHTIYFTMEGHKLL